MTYPIRVVQDNNVGTSQIDTQASGTCSQHENKLLTVRRVVLVDLLLTELVRSLTVETTVFVSAPVAVVFKDVKHLEIYIEQTLLLLKNNKFKKETFQQLHILRYEEQFHELDRFRLAQS